MSIDVTQIEGYAEMTAEEKVKALESLDIQTEHIDMSKYVSKEMFDKTASELASKKRELKAKMTEDEQRALDEQTAREELENKYKALLEATEIDKNKANLISLGFADDIAIETAKALYDGSVDTVLTNLKKHLDAYKKQITAELLVKTPKPVGDGESKTMTLEKFRKLSDVERYRFSQEHPNEYRALYGGN